MSSSPESSIDETVRFPANLSTHVSAVFKQRISRNFPRSRNGCLTCRSRRKKCDENRPTCTACLKNRFPCTWAQPWSQDKQNGITSQKQKPKSDSQDSIIAASILETNSDQSKLFSQPLPSCYPTLAKPWPQLGGFSGGVTTVSSSSASMLFNYYVSETALQIVASPGIKNPFLNIVLPLAFSDQLVMNGVLALAGAHIRYDESLNEQTVAATWSHHSQVLRDLQIALSRNQLDQERETLRILLVITILCIIESISGNPQDTFLHHLHASRELVLSIMSKPKGIENPANRELWGFLLEMYSYMVLVAAITPSGASNTPKVTLDGFLHSTEGVSQHGVCGNFFSGKNSIFEFVPEVSLLTSQRRREEETGTCSKESYAKYKDIVSRIRSWSMVEPADVDTVADLRTQRAAASILWQSALLIYLHSSFCEALQDDASLVAEIDIRIESASPLLGSLVLTPLGAIMMWPSMIIGSCARQKKQWEMFRTIGTMYRMNAVKHSLGLLTLLWQDPDPRAYGPRGLDFVMRKKGSNIIMF